MSSSLGLTRTVEIKVDLSDQLKHALRNRYGEVVDVDLNQSHLPYLEGIRDAGVKDAQKVIDAIIKHDYVHIQEYF